MKRSKLRMFTCLLVAMLCIMAMPVTAFASGGDYEDSEIPPETSETQPLTPDGNMNIVDDISGKAASDKQFITVTTKNGNYFYIIIDRAENGENTVHFLNKVDESDLMALLDGDSAPKSCTCKKQCAAGAVNTACPVCTLNLSDCTGKAPEPTMPIEPAEPEKEKGGTSGIFVLVTICALGATAVYFVKLKKEKPQTKGTANLDDYDYGTDEDDEYEFESYDPEEENMEDTEK